MFRCRIPYRLTASPTPVRSTQDAASPATANRISDALTAFCHSVFVGSCPPEAYAWHWPCSAGSGMRIRLVLCTALLVSGLSADVLLVGSGVVAAAIRRRRSTQRD